jgi:hypothetical protein
MLLAGFCGVAVAGAPGEAGSKPAVVLLDAAELSQTTARLRGEVDAKGDVTTFVFEYGTTAEYGTTTIAASAGSAGAWRLPRRPRG